MIIVSDFLLTGKENSTTAAELALMLNVNKRDITQAIENERRRGKPICATHSGGYYMAADKAEMKEYCDGLQRHISEICKTKNACRKTIDKLPEPETEDVVL